MRSTLKDLNNYSFKDLFLWEFLPVCNPDITKKMDVLNVSNEGGLVKISMKSIKLNIKL